MRRIFFGDKTSTAWNKSRLENEHTKFMSHYPNWQLRYDVPLILQEIYETNYERWLKDVKVTQ